MPQDVGTMRSFLGLDQLSQQIQPSFSWIKWPSQRDMQAENGIQAYKSLWGCISMLQGGHFQECHTSILQSSGFHMILQTDASKKGLGAVLLQNSKPMMFASRALTGSERNYQNPECECLATIWGMEKFHYFLYGKEFTLETDQKPLVSIYEKHIVEISPRIQRLIVRSLPISAFQHWTIQERSGNSTSRCTKSCYTITNGRGWNLATYHSSEHGDSEHSMQFQSNWITYIRKQWKDPTIKVLMHYISTGWPCEWKMLSQE